MYIGYTHYVFLSASLFVARDFSIFVDFFSVFSLSQDSISIFMIAKNLDMSLDKQRLKHEYHQEQQLEDLSKKM